MAISLPDARLLPDDVLQALRLRAVRGVQLGWTETQLAELLGVSHETISRWWSAFADGGLQALPHERSGHPLGSGRTLSDHQAEQIQQLLDQHQPTDLGLVAPLWTRRAVGDLIQRQLGIRLAVRTVGEYLRRWGYTVKKPRRHARKQDPKEVRHWLAKTYPEIEKRATAEGATIYWCDESGLVADQTALRGYAREGQPAVVEVPDPHVRMNQISAISNTGKLHFMTYAATMTAALFVVFLSRLLRSTTGKVFLIVDRLTAHEKAETWVAAHADRLELFWLPRRAPELNPDEYLNNDLKGQVQAQGLPNNKGELRSAMQGFLRRLLHGPQHIMSYFQHPCVQYAALT